MILIKKLNNFFEALIKKIIFKKVVPGTTKSCKQTTKSCMPYNEKVVWRTTKSCIRNDEKLYHVQRKVVHDTTKSCTLMSCKCSKSCK